MPRGRPRKRMDLEEVKTVKVETPKIEAPQAQTVTTRALTAEEAALKSILEIKDDKWLGLTDKDVEDFSLSEDPFKLPKEAQRLQDEKKYAFRWCENRVSRVMELTRKEAPFGWSVANAVNTPELTRLVDTITGGIHKLDQILLYKPHWVAMKEKELKQQADTARGNARDPNKRAGERDGNFAWEAGERAKLKDSDVTVFDQEAWDGQDSGESAAA